MKKISIVLLLFFGVQLIGLCQSNNSLINKSTPSISYYFDWINSEWPGSHEQKVLANLEFFKWMKETYDMQLDLYLMDAGNLDRSPGWVEEADTREEGLKYAYGDVDGERFRNKYPNGIDPMFKLASSMGTKMGIWLGPDGFGETLQEKESGINMPGTMTRKRISGCGNTAMLPWPLRPEHVKKYPKIVDNLKNKWYQWAKQANVIPKP